MPQIFQVLRCYKCLVFQVHQAKKSNKFDCKLCGEKQSIKRHYGIGTAKDCRMHVQKLNGIRGEIEEFKEANNKNADTDDDLEETNVEIKIENRKPKKSKWADFVNDTEETCEPAVQESMYLNDTKVVLEVPKKRKNDFICPSRKVMPSNNYVNVNPLPCTIKGISNLIDDHPRYQGKEIHEIPSKTTIDKTEKLVITNPTTQKDIKTVDENLEMESECCSHSNMNTKKIINVGETKQFVPQKVSSNSKWAQFIDDEDSLESSKTYENDEENQPLTTNIPDLGNSKELFALCDDYDLDNVLDI